MSKLAIDTRAAGEIVQNSVENLLQKTGAPRSLRALGVSRGDLSILAERALQDTCIVTSPRPADRSALISILEKAY